MPAYGRARRREGDVSARIVHDRILSVTSSSCKALRRNACPLIDIDASSCPDANSGPAHLLRAEMGHEDSSGDVIVFDCADLATERAIWARGLALRCRRKRVLLSPNEQYRHPSENRHG